MKKYKLNFVCPDCGHTQLTKATYGVIMYDRINRIEDDNGLIYAPAEADDYDIDYSDSYMVEIVCDHCTFVVGDDTPEALDWLTEHHMVEEMQE
jgi:RNA polymerase subunit RPABC4/transcription elongation factor Spt4